MNPPNPFGSPHGGAFQAPNSSSKAGLFQTFGQRSTGSQGQSLGFFQSSAFGQPSAMNQPSAQAMFGQPSMSQAPVFGQSSLGMTASGFGSSTAPTFRQNQIPDFGQTSGQNQTPDFGQTSGQNQTPVFGQTSGQNQTPSFGQTSGQNQTPVFGQTSGQNQTPSFGQTSGQNQTPAFGQTSGQNQTPVFGQTSGQNQTPVFGPTSGQNQTPVFGQTSGQNQTPVFGQTSGQNQTPVFGQTSGQNQTPVFGQTSGQNQAPVFGQTSEQKQIPVFGQTSGQNQTSAFGKTSGQNQAPVFGQNQTPAFGKTSGQNQTAASVQAKTVVSGQTSGQSQTPIFGKSSGQNQTPGFWQTPVFGQSSAFTQAPGFVKQPPLFGISQMATSSTTSFGQPSTTTSVFSGSQNVTTQSRTTSEFCFKPSNEVLFKPIFSASPEPANPQITTMSSSSFGVSGSQTSSSTSGFSLPAGGKSGPLSFNFLQPPADASLSALNNRQTTASSSTPTNTLQFTFSQPAAPSSSNTSASTTEPTTPSSFCFKAQPTLLLGGSGFVQSPAFDNIKGKEETGTDDKRSSQEDTNVFARLGKPAKRKDDPATTSSGFEKPLAEEDASSEADSPRHPSKRPLIRSRGLPGNLFSRALSGICKERANTVRRDVVTQKPASNLEEAEKVRGDDPSGTPAAAQTLTREVLEKSEGSDLTPSPKSQVVTSAVTPVSRGARRDSLDSLSGVSPSDLTTIMCRNVPKALNRKDVIEKHFARFGKVLKVFCRPAKNVTIVHFTDHAAAAKAKKKGKNLHRHELLLLWQKKKQSPGEKGGRPAGEKEQNEEGSPKVQESKAAASPLKRPTLMPPTLSSSITFGHSSPVKKPSPVKLLQFDPEPQNENATESQGSEHPVPSSLTHLIGQVAETTEDKYRLLEQMDKILRQGRPKRTDLDMSKVFVGTCPDMCPEKERYMRETRNQLSVFEVIPNTEMVDHAAAIKEYSRSSADQEEPLPHELRPLPVLSMTMDYLVTQILDQVQDGYRDWYDFVWNRTRGIRKDITQQRLCCPHTVYLIEKCTRFHVHCAHHLCEEHMSSFDAKINNENMTKCLQSLKEMYEDLATQQIFCPHEAEFRQYSVLLRLNDGDVLREAQQFREEVRNSPEVKFAVQAFAAVNNNNFVRFFKLVKGASYLASCLLHRYFNQVRTMALKALNIAHTVGPRSTLFPVEDVARMLMFQNIAEATDFVLQFGLIVTDGMVELSRMVFQEPDLPVSQKKSEIILAKKTVLIGQVVNGGPLPNPPQHIPVCSFDSQNKYRGSGLQAEPSVSHVKSLFHTADSLEVTAGPSIEPKTQFVPIQALHVPSVLEPPQIVTDETGEPNPPVVQPFQPELIKPPSPQPKPQPVYSDEDVVAELDSVIEEVVEAEAKEVADAGASYAAAALRESDVQVESLVREVLGQMLQEISSSEIKLEQQRVAEEKRKIEEARRRQEHEAFLAQFSCSLCTEIIHQVVDETVQETAATEILEALREKAERLAKCTKQICCGLIDETLNTEISLLVEDLLETELERIHKYIKRWRDVVAVRRKLKRQMRGFPAAPCCVDPQFKLKALAASAPSQPSRADLARGLVNLGNAGVLSASSTRLLRMREGAVHQMRVHYFFQQLLEETVWAPLDLPALVTENIPNPPDRIFWKTLLLLPSDHESVASLADRLLSDWLEVKLGSDRGSEEQPDGTMKTLCVINSLQENRQRTHKVHVAVKATRGPLTEHGLCRVEEFFELQGTGALILLLPALPVGGSGQEDQDVPLLSALLQLKQLQQINSWHCPLPLVVLVPGRWDAADTQKLEEALMLHKLMKEELISEYVIFFVPETTSDLQGSKQLTRAVRWLLARAPPPFPLSCRTLAQLIEASLSREFSPRVYADRQDRAAARLPSQGPGPIVRLYNSVLGFVADKVASQDLCGLSWPPAEFILPETREFVPHQGWNRSEHLAWLRKAILSLQLPEWEEPPAADSWSDLLSAVFRYAAKMDVSPRSQPLLISQLENRLERVRLRALHGKSPALLLPSVSSWVPWDDMVVIFTDHKLKDWQLPGPPVCKDAVTEDGEILVYFPAGSLEGFRPPDRWTRAVEQTHREKHQEMTRATGAAHIPSPRQKLFHSRVEPVDPPAPPLDITRTPTTEELRAHKVLQNIEEEKAESRRCTELFQRWLEDDPSDHSSTPLFIPSSILMSTPTTVQRSPKDRTAEVALTQKREPDERRDREAWSKTPPVSLLWRLKDLQRQISASREEELACSLKLNALLSIVDD